MTLKANRWVILACVAFLLTGCGAGQTDAQKELKPPSVYRDPQISVTRAPTATATASPTAGPSATPTVSQLFADSFVDNEQFFMNEIEYLLDKIERKLEQIDINP